MEIIMPLEGTYTVFLGDKHILLQEGDIIFICPGVLHSLAAPESGKRIILQIEWSVVSKIRDLNSILSLISPILTLTPQTAPDISHLPDSFGIRKGFLSFGGRYLCAHA